MQLNLQTSIMDATGMQLLVAMLIADDPRIKGIVPVVPQFALHQESELATKGIWTYPPDSFTVTPTGFVINRLADPTGKKTGCGFIVEWPERTTDSPGVTGPPSTYSIHIVSLEDRNLNLTPNAGIGITSDQLGDIAVDILHMQAVNIAGQIGTFQAKGTYLVPAHDWMEMNPGIYAHRATLHITIGRKQSIRGTNVLATFNNNQCTLNCSDITASVYYTTDGSPPVSVNPNAQLYTAPFPVTCGQVIYCASRNVGTILSEVLKYTAP